MYPVKRVINPNDTERFALGLAPTHETMSSDDVLA